MDTNTKALDYVIYGATIVATVLIAVAAFKFGVLKGKGILI